MSSLRNAIQRRNHRERAQPEERKRWGLLEKHKDYSLRAKDYNAKKARLRLLNEKAANRNPDEFSFGMMSSQSRGGVKIADRGNQALSHDVVKLLKSQDQGYIRTKLQSVRKERERLEHSLQFGDDQIRVLIDDEDEGGVSGKHIVFVDDKTQQSAFTAEEWFDVEEENTLDRTWNRQRRKSEVLEEPEEIEELAKRGRKARKAQASKEQEAAERIKFEHKKRRWQQARQNELEAVKELEKTLVTTDQELELQRARTNHQIGGVNKNGLKFKVRQRRR